MNELKLTLPLEVIQLKEEELALLKGFIWSVYGKPLRQMIPVRELLSKNSSMKCYG